MTDSTQTADNVNDRPKVIDLEVKEVHISNEELAQNYVDVKQAGQLLNNASERTFYRLLIEVKEKFKYEPVKVSVSQNGVRKNLYLKTDIFKMADLLNKQPAVIAYKTEYRTVDSGVTDGQSVNKSEHPHTAGRAVGSPEDQMFDSETSNNSKLAVIEGLKSITELRGSIRELNDNVRSVNMMMQNIMSKVVDQGIDLKERYLKDREDRTQIERQQAESLAKQSESFAKQSQALIELTKKIEQKKPDNDSNIFAILVVLVIVLVTAGWGAFYFFTTNQQKLESQFEERLAQEKQIQTQQYQDTIQQLKTSLKTITVNAAINAVVPQPAGQGTK